MSTTRKHIQHQISVNLFGLRDKIKTLKKKYRPKATKGSK